MTDQVTLKSENPARARRSIVLLVDCFRGDSETSWDDLGDRLFAPGSEGLFFLRLASLLASGSGGRVLLCAVLSVPESGSVSALSTVAQSLRQRLERWALSALQSPQTHTDASNGSVAQPPGGGAPSLIAPVVR